MPRSKHVYLEEALAKAKSLMPRWQYTLIHAAATPKADGRNRQNPALLENAALEAITKRTAGQFTSAELGSLYRKLDGSRIAASRKRKPTKKLTEKRDLVLKELRRRKIHVNAPLTKFELEKSGIGPVVALRNSELSAETMSDAFRKAFRTLKEILATNTVESITLMVGPPGAGKSTYVEKNPDGRTVYFDACSARKSARQAILNIGKEFGVPVDAVHVTSTETTCLSRNAERKKERRVPEDAIKRAYAHLVVAELDKEGFRAIKRVGDDGAPLYVTKGFWNGNSEGGMHAHGIDRQAGKTFDDGAHEHVWAMPGGGFLISDEDGRHEHVVKGDSTADDGAHSHRVFMPNGDTIESTLGGSHGHANMVESTGLGGLHKHILRFADGLELESLSPEEFIERFGGGDNPTGPLPPASVLTSAWRRLLQREMLDAMEQPAEPMLDDFFMAFEKSGDPSEISNDITFMARYADGSLFLKDLNADRRIGDYVADEEFDVEDGDVLICKMVQGKPIAMGFSDASEADTVEDATFAVTQAAEIEQAQAFVPFEGPDDPAVVFVGATPSALEVARKEGLVGPDGITFKELYLDPLGLTKNDIVLGFVNPARVGSDSIWSVWLQKQVDRFPKARIVALGKIAKAALGEKSILAMPHPSAVRRFGNSGEVDRKIRKLKKLLDTPRTTPENAKESSFPSSQEAKTAITPTDTNSGHESGETLVKITKAEIEKQIVYGVVLDPYVVDAHDDWIPVSEVEQTAHRFMEESRVIGLQHVAQATASVVESSLVEYPSDADYQNALANRAHSVYRRKFGSDTVHSGTWILAAKLGDAEWAAFKSGEITGFSIGGFSFKTQLTTDAMPEITFIDQSPEA